jgi:hypothetical protein
MLDELPTALPALNERDRGDFPLYVRFVDRIAIDELSGYSEMRPVELDLVEAYLEIAEDTVTNAWLDLMTLGHFGSLSTAQAKAFLKVRRLTNLPEEDNATSALAYGYLAFVEAMDDVVSETRGYFASHMYAVFLGCLNEFFGYDPSLGRSIGTDWSQLADRSPALFARTPDYADDHSFADLMTQKRSRVRQAWLETLATYDLPRPRE